MPLHGLGKVAVLARARVLLPRVQDDNGNDTARRLGAKIGCTKLSNLNKLKLKRPRAGVPRQWSNHPLHVLALSLHSESSCYLLG